MKIKLILFLAITLVANITLSQCKLDSSFYNFKYIPPPLSIAIDSTPGIKKSEYLQNSANLVQIQSNSKILINTHSSEHKIARFNEKGKIDKTYATNGEFILNNTPFPNSHIYDMKLYQDKLYLLCRNGYSKFNFIVAISSSGQLISTFGNAGILKLDTVAFSGLLYTKMEISNTGYIYVANLNRPNLKVAKINSSNGTLDTTFGTSGIATNTIGTYNLPSISDIKIDNSNNIILTGSNSYIGLIAIKLLPSGIYDNTFNTTGFKFYKHNNKFNYNNSSKINIHSNNNYSYTGSLYNNSTFTRDVFTIKTNSNGQVINTFGNSGWSIHSYGLHSNTMVTSQLSPKGNLIISSMFIETKRIGGRIDSSSFGLIMLDSNGNKDLSFAPSGIFKQNILFLGLNVIYDEVEVNSSIITPKGKVLLVGSSYDCSATPQCIEHGLAARFTINESVPYSIKKNNSEKIKIKIYPNPIIDILNFNTENNEIKSIQIMESTGRMVLHKQSDFKANSMNVSTLKKGIYFIKINFINGKYVTKKIIKK